MIREEVRPVRAGGLRAGNVYLDFEGHRLTVDGRSVRVTYQEFEVLGVLMAHAGEVVTHTSFCQTIWGSFSGRECKRLSVIISRLRHKLGGAHPYAIEAVRSRGYGLLLRPGEADWKGTPDYN